MQRPRPEDYSLKETSPHLGGAMAAGAKLTRTYDLVEKMQYLYVRVVKAKDLPTKDVIRSRDPYVEIKLSNYMGMTRYSEKNTTPEWNQVFAFSKHIQSPYVEVILKDKNFVKDDFIGRTVFDLNEVPKRVPPEGPLAPQWYRLRDRKGDKGEGEIMLAVWMGTQADEAFPEAWPSDAATIPKDGLASIRSMVYLTPKLWYLRVNVIEAQDLVTSEKSQHPELYVKATFGNQFLRTRISSNKQAVNPMWNEDLMFVAAEPFEEHLSLSVQNHIEHNKNEVLGKVIIPLQNVDRRFDYKPVQSKWYNLEKHIAGDGDKKKKDVKFSSRVHARICLEGGYHVLDESPHYISDLRATVKQLWKPSIGVLELGILNAQGVVPMKTKDGRGTTDAYCVAKYGKKWVRTRTIIDSFNPKWNEQYIWEVYDPSTVITIGVFDNCHLQGEKANNNKDGRIGKVRIHLSTLETDRVYTHSYPLNILLPTGVKKMGEMQLAVRFRCSSLENMMQLYSQPLLPKMHYLYPLSVPQLDNLRHQATQIVSIRLSRSEPPLRKEVVEYMLDVDSHMWSMRKSKANFFRIMHILGHMVAVGKWFDQICQWKNPLTTVLIHVLFIVLVLHPELILPTIFMYLFLIVIWYYRWRPMQPPHMDTHLSHVDTFHPDELDEEFDTFPTSRAHDVVRMRYDRLRSIAGKVQTVIGDIATQGERLQSLLSWRDPRATAIYTTFCLIAAVVMYLTPFRMVASVAGLYLLRHPRFCHTLPSAPLNFFRRLPTRADSLM